MSALRIVLAAVVFQCASVALHAQTIDETKQYITDAIQSYPPQGYTAFALFGDQVLLNDLRGLTSVPIEEEILERVLIYRRVLWHKESPYGTFTYLFDLKNITSIQIVSEETERGTVYTKLMINMRPGSYSWKDVKYAYGDAYTEKCAIVELPLGTSDAELGAVRVAFLHLSKLYGGMPLSPNLFNKD